MLPIKTAEQIRADAMAKADKEIKEAETKIAILNSLPVDARNPSLIHVYSLYQSIGSVCYRVKTKDEAYQIYKQFDVLPSYICRKGSVSIKCFDDETADTVSEIHAHVDIDKYHAELEFFTMTDAGIVRIKIEMPVSLFGSYRKDKPNARTNYQLDFIPLPKTCEMYNAITYARTSHFGDMSAQQKVYALYDAFEVLNQFAGE